MKSTTTVSGTITERGIHHTANYSTGSPVVLFSVAVEDAENVRVRLEGHRVHTTRGFNAGDTVAVRGYHVGSRFVAISVTR